MNAKSISKKRFCGNCTSHNAYSYPDKVFCTRRYLRNKEAIMSTLSCCNEWIASTQSCNCIGDAREKLRKQGSTV